jgi:hypothetical protein
LISRAMVLEFATGLGTRRNYRWAAEGWFGLCKS